MNASDVIPTGDLLRRLNTRWKLLVVGDGAMHPAELMEPFGNIDPRRVSETPSIYWLQKFAEHFHRSVWVNPDSPKIWDHTMTTRVIRRLFPMYHLSVDGIEDAVTALIGARAPIH